MLCLQCTRVQWTPPLRESFGYPLILAQILTVSWCLRQKVPHWKHLLYVATTTACSLVTWQFSQFVFLTQAIALLGLWFLHPVPHPTITVVFLGKLVRFLLMTLNRMIDMSFFLMNRLAYRMLYCYCSPMKCSSRPSTPALWWPSWGAFCLFQHSPIVWSRFGRKWDT